MKDLLKNLAINVVGWTVVAILAFIHAPIVRPICQIPYYGWFLAILVGGFFLYRLIKSIIALFKQKKFLPVVFTIGQLVIFLLTVLIGYDLSSGFSFLRMFNQPFGIYGNHDAEFLFYTEFWSLIIILCVILRFIREKKLSEQGFWRIIVIFILLGLPKYLDPPSSIG